jgi:hypothetical protein
MKAERTDEVYGDEKTAERMERGIWRFLNTPPQPHGKNPRSPAPSRKPKEHRAGKTRSLHLRCDATAAFAAIAAIRSELDRDLSRDARDRILSLLERPEEAFCVETEIDPAGTRKLTVRLNPSDRLAELLPALGAGNIDGMAVEET